MTSRAFSLLLVAFIAAATVVAPASAQPTHLAELFSNFNCSNCPGQDNPFYTFTDAHPEIAIIDYHNGAPDTKDPFYLTSQVSEHNRDVLYSAGTGVNDPSGFIDGTGGTPANVSSESNWTKLCQLNSPLTAIPITKSVGSDGTITLIFTVNAANTAKYYVALTESNITYANTETEGVPPSGVWNNIFRVMLPTVNGSKATFTGVQKDTIVYDPSQNPDWVVNNMNAVIFVQETTTSDSYHSYPIESLGVISLASSSAVSTATQPAAKLRIFSNPTPNLSRVGLDLPTSSNVRVTLTDLLGRMQQTLLDGPMPGGESSIEIEGKPYPAGCYLLRLIVDGREVDQAKVIVE